MSTSSDCFDRFTTSIPRREGVKTFFHGLGFAEIRNYLGLALSFTTIKEIIQLNNHFVTYLPV